MHRRALRRLAACFRKRLLLEGPYYSRTSVFILAGSGGKETYEPRFFHAGMQRVTVAGLAGEPAPDDLVICRISSMRTPAGAFRCSDETVNWLEQAVRRTAVDYTTFLPKASIGSHNDLLKETWAGGQALMPSLGGSIARWCYRALGGIRPDPDGPGFRKMLRVQGAVALPLNGPQRATPLAKWRGRPARP